MNPRGEPSSGPSSETSSAPGGPHCARCPHTQVDGLACYFGGRHSDATWQSNNLVSCRTPDLHSVATAVAEPPADSVPDVMSLFDAINRVSSDVLDAAPHVDLLFSEPVRRAAAAARAANLDAGLEPQPFALGGALTVSGGVTITDGVARLSTPRPRSANERRGGGLLRIALPNCDAPLQTFDLQVRAPRPSPRAQWSPLVLNRHFSPALTSHAPLHRPRPRSSHALITPPVSHHVSLPSPGGTPLRAGGRHHRRAT